MLVDILYEGFIDIFIWTANFAKNIKIMYIYGKIVKMTDHTSRLNVQLYSVRDLIGTPGLFAKNHEHVLRSLVMMGYTGVEAISYDDGRFSGLAPEEFSKTLNDAGLELVSSHVIRMLSEQELASGDFSEALEWWDKCISAHNNSAHGVLLVPTLCPHNADSGH